MVRNGLVLGHAESAHAGEPASERAGQRRLLAEVEEYDLYPAVRRYVLDEVEVFCDGLEAM